MTVLNDLLAMLALERIEEGHFRGQSQDLGFGAVFGGQVMGQALSAAYQTVSPERMVHSLHCYFLRPGDVRHPILYEVEHIRDGNTVSTRRVQAIQHGKSIFYLNASFQLEEPGLDHQDEMPQVQGPDGLRSEQEWAEQLKAFIPPFLHDKLLSEKPIEMRPVSFVNPLQAEPCSPNRYVWFKANGQMPDDPAIHRYLLAYASDFNFLPTALQPHGVAFFDRYLQVATIDHAMWFHRDFRFDDWLLYAVDSPSASGGRGLVRGQFFNRQGKLVASTIQEGVIRRRIGDN
ncbi:MAG: acyl-CoA thioesterase II [Aeromonadaceae bacterium]